MWISSANSNFGDNWHTLTKFCAATVLSKMLWQQAMANASRGAADTPETVNKRARRSPMWMRSPEPDYEGQAPPRPSWMAAVDAMHAASATRSCSSASQHSSQCSSASRAVSFGRPMCNRCASADEAATDLSESVHADDLEFAAAELSEEEAADVRSDDEGLMSADAVDSVPGRRLWDARVLHPAGVAKWDNTANCQAALAYKCPCDIACLSKVGDVIQIYEHRRKFRLRLGSKARSGALRDTLRELLAEHYDAGLGTFSNSFVVCGVGGMCDRAYAAAAGVSEATFMRARSDVTKERPKHAGRVQVRARRVSFVRAQLDAWVRAQRNTMEGDKSTGLKWFTEKVTERQLWLRYVRSCDHAQVPCHSLSGDLLHTWGDCACGAHV